jgi:hypothetical protein
VSYYSHETNQLIHFIKDGKTESPGMVSAFRRFLDGKDDFGLGHVVGPEVSILCE